MSVYHEYGQGVAYYSTILGNPCRIMNPVGIPKPKEECQPFTFTLYDLDDPRHRPTNTRQLQLAINAQEKLLPKLEKAAAGKMGKSRATPLSGFLARRLPKVYAS